MKREQLKNVYQQVCLTEKQKDRIWQRIEADSKTESILGRTFLPTRIAVCFGVLLMSGMTVFAANEFSLMDKIDEAMKILTQNKEELTTYQKDLYTRYGQALDNEFALDNGTLKLDAVLYDGNHLLIPFRYIYHSDFDGYEELIAGTDIRQTSLWRPSGTIIGYDNDIRALTDWSFYIVHNANQMDQISSSYFMRNLTIVEDGTISGSLLLVGRELQSFEPGAVVQLGKEVPMQETKSYEILSEFTLGDALEQQELSIDAQNAAVLEKMGVSVEHMIISPISLSCYGKGTHTQALSASITIVLKDGSVIEKSPTGSGYSLSDTNQDNTSFSFCASQVFAAPVLLEDIAEIHIQDYYSSADIRIPF